MEKIEHAAVQREKCQPYIRRRGEVPQQRQQVVLQLAVVGVAGERQRRHAGM
jgi:hypothetical protein